MLNNITLHGRLVRAPILRRTQSNTPVTSFTLAVDRDTKDKQTDFIDCTAWRYTGEFIADNFDKGNAIIVNGRLQIREWTDKDGNKRRNAEVNVDRAWFCEPKRRVDDDERPPMPSDADAPPEVDQQGLAELAAAFPNNVQYADADAPLPWE